APSMLIAAAKSANIYSLIDNILSVESVGVFKPHPTTYQLAVEQLKVEANRVSFQSSNGWDAHAAAASGLVVVWVNRFDQTSEILPENPHAEIKRLSDLPRLLGL
ncbi:MAG: HAD-IA family hydrolase, partial [Pseudomonadota bacterium]|nr:HAD-IA family hydrolase [Pseudomonadota bacterium]